MSSNHYMRYENDSASAIRHGFRLNDYKAVPDFWSGVMER